MNNNEQPINVTEIEPDHDWGKPLLVDWMDSDWFQVWLKLARHEDLQAA